MRDRQYIVLLNDAVKAYLVGLGGSQENWYAVNPAKGEKLLESLLLTEQNTELFAESRRHYRRAVDLLAAEGRLEEAARVCEARRLCRTRGDSGEGWPVQGSGQGISIRQIVRGRPQMDAPGRRTIWPGSPGSVRRWATTRRPSTCRLDSAVRERSAGSGPKWATTSRKP